MLLLSDRYPGVTLEDAPSFGTFDSCLTACMICVNSSLNPVLFCSVLFVFFWRIFLYRRI